MKKRDRELIKKQQDILRRSKVNAAVTLVLSVVLLIIIILQFTNVLSPVITESLLIVILGCITYTMFRSWKIRKDTNSLRMFIITCVVATVISFISISHIIRELNGSDDVKEPTTEEKTDK